MTLTGPFRRAIPLLLIAAALYLFAFIPASFDGSAFSLIPYGILFAVIAAGLGLGWRWLGYVAFFATFIAGIAALGGVWASSPVPGWIYVALIVVHWLAAAMLFLALWSRPEPVQA